MSRRGSGSLYSTWQTNDDHQTNQKWNTIIRIAIAELRQKSTINHWMKWTL